MKKPNRHTSKMPKDATPVHRVTPHIPGLDDYELPREFPFDPAKMKRNPYAGRIKYTRGGARKGAGRKPSPEPVERHTVTLKKAHAQSLRGLDPSLSRALHQVLAKVFH